MKAIDYIRTHNDAKTALRFAERRSSQAIAQRQAITTADDRRVFERNKRIADQNRVDAARAGMMPRPPSATILIDDKGVSVSVAAPVSGSATGAGRSATDQSLHAKCEGKDCK